jgi:hypothetical protein
MGLIEDGRSYLQPIRKVLISSPDELRLSIVGLVRSDQSSRLIVSSASTETRKRICVRHEDCRTFAFLQQPDCGRRRTRRIDYLIVWG